MTQLEARPPASYAEPAAVAKQLKVWDDNVLSCRTYGHNWTPHRATHHKRYRYFAVAQLCSRCGTQRHIEMSERGVVFASWYEYIDGYLSEGLGRIVGDARDTLRLAAVTRTFSITEVMGGRKGQEEELPRSGAARDALGIEAD